MPCEQIDAAVQRMEAAMARMANGDRVLVEVNMDGEHVASNITKRVAHSFNRSRENLRPVGRAGV